MPVTLELPFEQADIAGSSTRALRVAVQDAQGRWGVLRAATVDAVARKVRLTTSHFSDYSMVIGWQLRPGSATVAPGQSVAFAVRMCAPASAPGDEDLVGLLAACTETLEPHAVANLEWAVNAIRGGNATVGTVTSSGVYTAPASAPSPNVVAVSAEMSFEGDKDLLVANVTVTSAGYGGTVVFSGRSSDSTGSYTFAGSAQLSFIKDPATTLFQLVPGESSVRFDTWDFTSSQLVCRLAAAATIPFASVGSLTLLDALKSYAWVAVVQAQGRENCSWVATGERFVRDAFPATMLGTQQGQTPGFLPYTDAAQLEGRNVIDESSAGGSLHVENSWTLVRVP